MRLSKLHVVTLRDDPADAEIPSHRLLARAGYIVKVASGLYTYGPLMWRSMKKVIVVREELDREGALEVMMPMMHPKELWVSSGRWERYVADGILFTLKDSKGAEFCLGPTHEEVITAYADQTITSYKQLPVNLYQIQDKFRDEIRPRFGLMRGREFIMMDAYSFDPDRGRVGRRRTRRWTAPTGAIVRPLRRRSTPSVRRGRRGDRRLRQPGVHGASRTRAKTTILYCEESCKYAAKRREGRSSLPAEAGR